MTVVPLPTRGEQTLEDAFPTADPGALPFGDRVLVQLRTPKMKTKGGIMLPQESRDQDKWVTTIGKLISIGPLAFKDRSTLEPWPEGFWAQVGNYVRCPKWGGDRWEVNLGDDWETEMVARFVIYRDRELIALITGDPLRFKDYV